MRQRTASSESESGSMQSRFWRVAATLLVALTTPMVGAASIECDPDPYRFIANDFRFLQKKYSNSVILINCGRELPEYGSLGTGFLIDSKMGLFLTAYHVIKPKQGDYDCTTADSRIVAYPLGDMCKRTELRYVRADAELDIALLQVRVVPSTSEQTPQSATKSYADFYRDKPHFELLTDGMPVNGLEIEGIGVSQFAAILKRGEKGPRGTGMLPGIAGGHQCGGVPQPYHFQPITDENERIEGRGPTYLRRANARGGDSGAPIFLADGRVAGIITDIGFGEFDIGTKVTSASDIVTWLMPVFRSDLSLGNDAYSLEAWPSNTNIYYALNPDACALSNSCIPNVRIAAELQKIPENGAKFGDFTKQQWEKLQCPVYMAAEARDIRPEIDFLRVKLNEHGEHIGEPGYKSAARAKRIIDSTKYTSYTKISELQLAEASLARDLGAIGQEDPDIFYSALCVSGLSADQIQRVEAQLRIYLRYFRPTDSMAPSSRAVNCPGNPNAAELKQVKALTAMIADIKVAQESIVKKTGGPADVSATAAATALAALMNSDNKHGAGALIDLANTLVKKDPDLAAGVYAKAFEIHPSTKAIAGFEGAVKGSSELAGG
jgi:hypothetical protein